MLHDALPMPSRSPTMRSHALAALRGAYAVLRLPLVTPLLVWLYLFHRARQSWDEKYTGGIVWAPAFPRPIAYYALVLAVTPFWAALRLAWLLFAALVSFQLKRRRARGRHGRR